VEFFRRHSIQHPNQEDSLNEAEEVLEIENMNPVKGSSPRNVLRSNKGGNHDDDEEASDQKSISSNSSSFSLNNSAPNSPSLKNLNSTLLSNSGKQESPLSNSVSADLGDWPQRYHELEQRCNLLSKRAVQTIQESKLQLVIVQQENLELQDRIRDLQDELQRREEDKSKATSLIPRLIEMVRKLQAELNEEKKKRDLDLQFDELQLRASRQ